MVKSCLFQNETPKESAYNWTIHGTEAQRMKVTWNTMLDVRKEKLLTSVMLC